MLNFTVRGLQFQISFRRMKLSLRKKRPSPLFEILIPAVRTLTIRLPIQSSSTPIQPNLIKQEVKALMRKLSGKVREIQSRKRGGKRLVTQANSDETNLEFMFSFQNNSQYTEQFLYKKLLNYAFAHKQVPLSNFERASANILLLP